MKKMLIIGLLLATTNFAFAQTDTLAIKLKKPLETTGANGNNFTDPTGTGGTVNGISGTTFLYNTTPITITNGLIAKIIPIYNSTKIAVVGSGALPPQGKVIESVGTAGDTKRKIIYYESYPQIPNEIFPYAILSQ